MYPNKLAQCSQRLHVKQANKESLGIILIHLIILAFGQLEAKEAASIEVLMAVKAGKVTLPGCSNHSGFVDDSANEDSDSEKVSLTAEEVIIQD